MRGKLTDRFSSWVGFRGRPQVLQEVLPEQGPELNLTDLAEKRFVMGIFSRAPERTTEKK